MGASQNKNLYEVLGISISADAKEIKEAYRILAKKYHPDRTNGKSTDKFKEIVNAYEILSDKENKKRYDNLNGFNQPQKQKTTRKEHYSNTANTTTKTETKNKKEKNFSENFSNFVNDIFSTKSNSQTQEKGKDIFLDLTINEQEAITGTKRTINIVHEICCPKCKGKKFLNSYKCSTCNGNGIISDKKSITVNIPANIKNGKTIRLKGEGNCSTSNGENGNLYLKINIEKSTKFRFEGLNVLGDIPISPVEAALGATIKISTINGIVNMTIPEGTSSKQKFRLHEQGLTDKQTHKKGDHIVTVYIKMPSKLSQKEKDLYKKLAELNNFNPRNEDNNE